MDIYSIPLHPKLCGKGIGWWLPPKLCEKGIEWLGWRWNWMKIEKKYEHVNAHKKWGERKEKKIGSMQRRFRWAVSLNPSYSPRKKCDEWVLHKRKRKRSDSALFQSPYAHRKIKKATWQHKKRHQNFHYTTIADWLRTVSWSNSSHPTGVVKPVNEWSCKNLPVYLVSSYFSKCFCTCVHDSKCNINSINLDETLTSYFIVRMVFLELSMIGSNVNEFSRIKKILTFNRYTETNMHHLALPILIYIILILKYHKYWLRTRRHIIEVLCMTFSKDKMRVYLTEKHDNHVNFKLCTEKNVFSLIIGTMLFWNQYYRKMGCGQFLPNATRNNDKKKQ